MSKVPPQKVSMKISQQDIFTETTHYPPQKLNCRPLYTAEWSWGHLSWVCVFVNYFAMSMLTCFFFRPWCQTFNLQLCFLQQFGNKVRGSQSKGKAIPIYVYPVSQINNMHSGKGGFEGISKSRNSCTKTCNYNIWDPFPTPLGIHLSVIFRFFGLQMKRWPKLLLYILHLISLYIFSLYLYGICLGIFRFTRSLCLTLIEQNEIKDIDQSSKMEEGVGIRVTKDVTSKFWKQILKATAIDFSVMYMLQVNFDFTLLTLVYTCNNRKQH